MRVCAGSATCSMQYSGSVESGTGPHQLLLSNLLVVSSSASLQLLTGQELEHHCMQAHRLRRASAHKPPCTVPGSHLGG